MQIGIMAFHYAYTKQSHSQSHVLTPWS